MATGSTLKLVTDGNNLLKHMATATYGYNANTGTTLGINLRMEILLMDIHIVVEAPLLIGLMAIMAVTEVVIAKAGEIKFLSVCKKNRLAYRRWPTWKFYIQRTKTCKHK